MTSSPVKHSSYIWCLLEDECSLEFTTAGPLMNILNMCLGNTHTHTLLRGRNTTSASVWVHPYVYEASGLYGTTMRESRWLIGNRHADRQAVLLHNSRCIKKKKKTRPGSPPPPPRPARGQMAAEESGSLPCHSSTDASLYLLKNKSDSGQACPGSGFDLPQPHRPAAFNPTYWAAANGISV